MTRRTVAVAALGAIVAVLLPVGVLAATSASPFPDRNAPGRSVGAAALGLQGFDAERASSVSTVTTPVVTVPRVTPASTVPPPVSTSRPTGATTTPTSRAPVPAPPIAQLPAAVSSLLPGLLPPAVKVAPTSWSIEKNGIRLRMRVEAPVPPAVLSVSFIVDISSDEPCCGTGLSFGDSSEYAKVGPNGSCAAVADVTGAVVQHTYALPGVYRVQLVAATFPCKVTMVDGKPVLPSITGADIVACVAVGPGFVAHDGQC